MPINQPAYPTSTSVLVTHVGTYADAEVAAAKARATHSGTQLAATISDLTEAVQDIVAALLVAGTGTTITYNDAANTLTVATTGMDAEAVRDTIGVALRGTGNISITVDDAADTITVATTATVNATDAALRDRATHTGAQPSSTITGLDADLASKMTSVGTLAAPITSANHARPAVSGPVYWVCASGIDPVNKQNADIVWTPDYGGGIALEGYDFGLADAMPVLSLLLAAATGNSVPANNRTHLLPWTPRRDGSLLGLRFYVRTAGGAADPCAVAVYDNPVAGDLTRLAVSTTATGLLDEIKVEQQLFTTPYAFEGGQNLQLAMSTGVTTAQMAYLSTDASRQEIAKMLGDTRPKWLAGRIDVHPPSATIVAANVSPDLRIPILVPVVQYA